MRWVNKCIWPVIFALAACASHAGNAATAPTAADGRPLLGIVPDLASEDSHVGVLIAGTTPGTPAAVGGIEAGDLLVRLGDRDVQNLDDLTRSMESTHPGDKVSIIVLRASRTVKVDVVMAWRKE